MSLIRSSTSHAARVAAFQSRIWAPIIHRRFESGRDSVEPKQAETAPPPPPDETSVIRQEERESGTMVHHERASFDPPVDHATSQFSPIPKRIMDGSEGDEILPAAVISGAPVSLQARTAYIYRPAKSASQSGDWHGHVWRMDWNVLGKGHRWENDLMGWQSTGDFIHATHIDFRTKDDAIRFAEKHGYDYFVQQPPEKKFVPKAYANNFIHSPRKLRVIRTK